MNFYISERSSGSSLGCTVSREVGTQCYQDLFQRKVQEKLQLPTCVMFVRKGH